MPLSGAPEGHLSVEPNRYPKVCEPKGFNLSLVALAMQQGVEPHIGT